MSFPHFSIGLIIVLVVAYIVGARWPMLAQKVGLA
jgi:hypothetical protein